jgi:hypothetical protein
MSTLPKIDYPVYTIEVPSLKKNFRFRPFLVKEEKLLLMAKESESTADILTTVKQIINNCSVETSNFDIDKLAIFDLEYIFLKLRAFSVDNVIKVAYKDLEDEKIYNLEIKLDEVKVKYPENAEANIKITDNSGIIMRYPSAKLYDDKEFLNLEKDYMFELIVRCIDSIYVGEEIYESKNYTAKELTDFLENLNIKSFESIQNFLMESPKLHHEIKYKNSLNNERTITYSSLNDFFMWR